VANLSPKGKAIWDIYGSSKTREGPVRLESYFIAPGVSRILNRFHKNFEFRQRLSSP
jgi:hypothetical protein